MVFVSALPFPAAGAANAPGPAPSAISIQRTWFAYYDPAPAADGTPREPRGVVLIMPGLLGTPRGTFELAFAAMRQRGWAVLRMLAQPSRFLERTVVVLDADDLEGTAQRIARDYSERAAECAFAVEAAFDYIESIRPGLASLPRVALGGSGGAMTLPTVVAREPGRYAAAVMLAGGADLWLITSRSNYADMIGATALRYRDRALTDDEHRRLDELYLQHAPLDPFHTAKALHGKHVLMLHGAGDRAVPADLGDVLWERLGRPERWSFPVGHELLFMGLPSQFPRILDWLDAALPPPGAPPGSAAPPAPAAPNPEEPR
jgi:predicted esterase